MKLHRSFALAAIVAVAMLTAGVCAQEARDIRTLSPQERLNLPGTTRVTIAGKTVTLDQLRRNHTALVASRTRVQSLTFAKLKVMTGRDLSFKEFHPGVPRGPINLATPSPMPATLPLVKSNGAPYPNDYQQFCSSMPATVCLYYPAGVTWIGQDPAGNFLTIDLNITDPNVCSQTGGYIGTQPLLSNVPGCIYSYPSTQTAQFVPPAKGFTTSGWCDLAQGYFSKTIDNHGAVNILDNGAHNKPTEAFCFLQVRLTQ